jgi:hypothetical protein
MSALPPKADIVHDGGDVRFVPEADIALRHSIASSARPIALFALAMSEIGVGSKPRASHEAVRSSAVGTGMNGDVAAPAPLGGLSPIVCERDIMKVILRRATEADAKHAASLLTELGYPSTEADARNRLARSLRSRTSYCLVAESAGEVVGLISAELVSHGLNNLQDHKSSRFISASRAWSRSEAAHGGDRLRARASSLGPRAHQRRGTR